MTKWQRERWDGRTWVTTDPEEMEEIARAIAEDREDCQGCAPGNPVSHTTSYVVVDDWGVPVLARTYRCRSLSRWFNPETRAMEGRAHCTCDSCW